MESKLAVILIVVLVGLIVFAGCIQNPPANAVCGNGIVESGEQCDVNAGNCAAGTVCENCTCKNLEPPALPA